MTALNPTTVAFIAMTVIIIGFFDLYQLIRKGSDATISHVLYASAQRYPIVAFVIGVICGHLFWVNK